MNRRGLLVGLLAAPIIIRSPGILMPVKVETPWVMSYFQEGRYVGRMEAMRHFVRDATWDDGLNVGFTGWSYHPQFHTLEPASSHSQPYDRVALHKRGERPGSGLFWPDACAAGLAHPFRSMQTTRAET